MKCFANIYPRSMDGLELVQKFLLQNGFSQLFLFCFLMYVVILYGLDNLTVFVK